MKRFIISLMAANQVGIMAALTEALDDLKGDIQEVSQTVMQQFFTIILAADFPDECRGEDIVSHIEKVCEPFKVDVTTKEPAREELFSYPEESVEKYFLTVTGPDQRGIVRRIATRLEEVGIDITDLHAVRDDQRHEFLLVMELAVPAGIETAELTQELEQLGNAEGLAAAFQHENIFAATHDLQPVRLAFRMPGKTELQR
ncbi:MAG: ACT domain-containing protein [Planctomycetaceae bacterium]|jgi:predicted amino acid-binding ACT domain protein